MPTSSGSTSSKIAPAGLCDGLADGLRLGDALGLDVGISVEHLPLVEGSEVVEQSFSAFSHIRVPKQSSDTQHFLSVKHFGHSGPPQPTSVSNPFTHRSSQLSGVGDVDGDAVGDAVGDVDGLVDGDALGLRDGDVVGATLSLGEFEGDGEGSTVGDFKSTS